MLEWAWRKVDRLSAFSCAEGGRPYDAEHYRQGWAQWLALLDRAYAVVLLALLVGCAAPDPVAVTGPVGTTALLESQSGSAVASYIVVLSKGSDPSAVANSHGVSPRHVYRNALKGFSARMSPEAAAALSRNPNVAYVEPDGVATLGPTVAAFTPRIWGPDRINQREIATAGDLDLTMPNDGSGVHAYIIDTGLRASHQEFGGRVEYLHNAVTNQPDPIGDCNGHGTHVAGTVGGATYGVARAVTLVSVRVFDQWFGSELGEECFPSTAWSNIIAGMDWVAANRILPAVANISLGGPFVQAVNDATAGLVASGVTVAIAAGNSSLDACTQSPGSTPAAITVAASNIYDQRAYFSNGGPCVDLFAPGEQIISSYWLSDADVEVLNGTSMASPHVAGVAALYLHANPGATPGDVRAALVGAATPGALSNFNVVGTPNLLLYTDWGSVLPPPPTEEPPDPTAFFGKSCSGYTCTFTATNSGAWTFGDGVTQSSGLIAVHTYRKGQYTVTHTVAGNPAAYSVQLNCKPKNRCQ
jgi:subtilisin family serine protease